MTEQMQNLVDAIFAKLTIRYGRDFIGRWEGVDLLMVKADWAYELTGYENKPAAVRHALQNLPLRAPHVGEFLQLCRNAPEHRALGLPEPEPTPEQKAAVQKLLAKCRANLNLNQRGR